MYLSQLKLWNFRKFGEPDDEIDLTKPNLVVDFNKGLNLLVGENDSGKSCVIDAIKLTLRTHSIEWIKVENDDFYKDKNRLRIECHFNSLSDEEAKNFVEWLGVDGSTDPKPNLKLILDAQRTQDRILPYEIKGGPGDDGKVISAEAREYLKTTYLKPLRDAKAELIARKNSRLSQILEGHPVFRDKENHKLVEILTEANNEIKKYFEDESDQDHNGYKILKTLKEYLANFLSAGSGQDTRFHIDDPKLKNILELLKLTLYDERSGLGTYNLLFIAAELLHLKRENYDGLKLGLIEEVEAHLHPQAQLRVIAALENESTTGGIQLILSTHSANLASKVAIKKLILCYGSKLFPLGPTYTKLGETDYNFLERFLDVTKANLFFAQGIIMVEGDSENILIPTLARLVNKDLTAHGISIVNVGGVTFLRYSKIFKRAIEQESIGLSVSIVTDLDIKPEDEGAKKGLATQTKEQKYDGQGVKTFVSPHQTFEYCLALSLNLNNMLFEAIKAAGTEMTEDGRTGKQVDDAWTDFSDNLTPVDLAKKIYELIVQKGISKTIIAQHLAKSIEEKSGDAIFINNLKQDENIDYLFKAIDYAETNNHN
ncbi:AAA family ATPase [Candidatus Amesbacteria bacterium]|nr:AAA family ATPase [Candidatus Amesbacteria bacterium]